MVQLSEQQARLLSDSPVGRLSTASQDGAPHVIPVCFALDTQRENNPVYIALDQKPKRAALTRLRRVRNILENPRVALVVDHYNADWSQLWYILLTGTAQLLQEDGSPESEGEGTSDATAFSGADAGQSADTERRSAIALLRQKYPQYRDMEIDANPVIKIIPQRIVSWSYSPDTF